MASEAPSQQALPRKIYRMRKGQQLRALLLASMAALLGIATPFNIAMPESQFVAKTITTLVIVIICGGTALFIAYTVFFTRLILTPEGLEYDGGFIRSYTPWKNIKDVGRISKRRIQTEVLTLRQPSTWSSWRIPGVAWFVKQYKFDRSIPLTVFVWQFRGSELEKDIIRYVPRLKSDR